MKNKSVKVVPETPSLATHHRESLTLLTNAIYEGIESGIVQNFNPKKQLAALKAAKKKML